MNDIEKIKNLLFKLEKAVNSINSNINNKDNETYKLYVNSIYYNNINSTFYIKKTDNNGNNTYYTIEGNIVTPDINNLTLLSEITDFETLESVYYSKVTKPNYVEGDIILQIKILNINTGLLNTNIYFNLENKNIITVDLNDLENGDYYLWNYQNQKLKDISENTQVEGNLITGISANSVNTDLITNTLNGWFNVSKYQSASIQIINGTGTGSIMFEQTNDNTNTTGLPLAATEITTINTNPIITAISFTANQNRLFRLSLNSKYIRVRITTAFSLTGVKALSMFSQFPFSSNLINIQQQSQSNLLLTAYQALGTAATRWFSQISDGTNSPAIKAASTAPTATDPSLTIALSPNTAITTSSINSGASVNSNLIKSSAGTIHSIIISNVGTVTRFFKLYNKATAPSSSDTPILIIPVKSNEVLDVAFGLFGLRLTTGIGYLITANAPDNDNTSILAGEVKTIITYN